LDSGKEMIGNKKGFKRGRNVEEERLSRKRVLVKRMPETWRQLRISYSAVTQPDVVLRNTRAKFF